MSADLLARLESALADRYTVESEIGRGGMAVVFLAQDLRHERRVAIKVLHPELTATLGAERFLQEIKTVAGLQHPHILPPHGMLGSVPWTEPYRRVQRDHVPGRQCDIQGDAASRANNGHAGRSRRR